jgi:hypothetical protein
VRILTSCPVRHHRPLRPPVIPTRERSEAGGFLFHHSRRTPTLHGWIEMKLKKVFKCYDVDRSLIVGTKRLYAGWHDDVNPRLKHGFQISYCNSFIYRGEKKAKPPRTLGHDLASAFS